jgi:multiple sugar transport system substrate-binding protein
MWGFGGMEVEKDGKTVIIDRKETLEAIKFNTACWKDCFDEGGLTWDDSSNNRAFLAGSISITGNSPSIYVIARTKFPDLYKAMNHAPNPLGPAGRFYQLTALNAALLKYSKNQKLAREFIRWFMDKKQYGGWFHAMDTYAIPGTKEWYKDPIWKKDPKCTVMRDVIKDARVIGYAGAPGKKATEAFAKYIVVDMFAKAIQGAAPEEALKWAAVEMRKIYS